MPELGESLSERELEVLAAMIDGSTNKQIAADLFISQNTVKVHLRNIYTKLGVSSRTEAVALAMQQGLLPEKVVESALLDEEQDESGAAAEPESSGSEADQVVLAEAAGERIGETAVSPETFAFWSHWRTLLLLGAILVLAIALGIIFVQNRNGTGQTNGENPAEPAAEFTELELADNWRQSRDMPAAAAGMALAAVGLDVYQIGGETAAGVTDAVWRYETTRFVWQARAAKPTAVADVTAVELFGELFVAGGRLEDGTATNVVEAYSPANDAWRTVQPLPRPVYGAALVTDGSFLYVFGGTDGSEFFGDGYKFDPAGNSWQPIAPLPTPRAQAAAGIIAGNLYVVGGQNNGAALDTCEYYQPQEDRWLECASLLTARAGAGTAVLVNKLYLVGGGLTGESVTHSEAYDPNTDSWSLVNTPMLAETPRWTDLGVANVETKIYVVGGERGNQGLSDKTYVYTPFVYNTYIPAASSSGP